MIHASLFSGIGGPEVAAAMMGWSNAFHCEINPFGKAVLDYWFPESKSYEDITKTDFREWRGKIDILTGGFPCQPFSYAGKRGGADDNRYLWPEMLRAIDEIRPTWVVGENVAGITTMVEGGVCVEVGNETTLFGEDDGVHRYGLRESFTIERICSDLENLGYTVQPLLIPAAAVGAPHRRDRIFIIAHVADSDCRDDLRIAGEDEGKGKSKGVSERYTIRKPGEPDNLRPEIQGNIKDTISAGARREGRKVSDERRATRQDWGEGIRQGDGATRSSGTGATGSDASANPSSDGLHGGKGKDGKERCADKDGKRTEAKGADGVGLRSIPGIYGEQFTSPDTDGGRKRASFKSEGSQRGRSDADVQQGEWGQQTEWADGLPQLPRITTNTNSGRSGEIPSQVHSRLPDGAEPFSDGGKWYASNSNIKGLERNGGKKLQGLEGREGGNEHPASGDEYFALGTRGLHPEARWASFPTVSPVHRGNDGLPFSMDDLTIPSTKWRTESLKAYGNAIVPQVMYRIFQAIQQCDE